MNADLSIIVTQAVREDTYGSHAWDKETLHRGEDPLCRIWPPLSPGTKHHVLLTFTWFMWRPRACTPRDLIQRMCSAVMWADIRRRVFNGTSVFSCIYVYNTTSSRKTPIYSGMCCRLWPDGPNGTRTALTVKYEGLLRARRSSFPS